MHEQKASSRLMDYLSHSNYIRLMSKIRIDDVSKSNAEQRKKYVQSCILVQASIVFPS